MHYLDFDFLSLSKSNLSMSSACTCCEAAMYLQYSIANSPLPCQNRSPKTKPIFSQCRSVSRSRFIKINRVEVKGQKSLQVLGIPIRLKIPD